MLFQGDCAAALAVFEENVASFPLSANARDSLAEARAASGEIGTALEGYAIALALEPDYPNAEAARRFLEEHGAGVERPSGNR